jgi:integrase/recombinase XerD
MSNLVSENLIFELSNELTTKNLHIDKDLLYESISKIIVKYEVSKLQSYQEECNLETNILLYLSAKKLEGLSDSTIKGYEIHLQKFSEKVHKNVEMISTADIRVYLSEFNYLKASSMATKISVLKSFFGWLLQEEIIEKDPLKKIKSPKFNKFNPKFLNVDELEMLRESCINLRERALVEILYATGLRVGELERMNIKDIDFTNFSAIVIGKGGKEREVLFSLKAIHHLKKYMSSRNDDCSALFVTERKPYRRMKKRTIQKDLKNIAERSSIEKNVTPHILRHSFASLSLNNNMDIAVISKLLGHSNISTTQIYAHISDENKRYQYRKHLVL